MPIPLDAASVISRYEHLKTNRKNWESLWEEVADYVLPHKADFITVHRTTGDRTRTFRLFDSTALHANHLLASHLHGSLTSDAYQWFRLRFRNTKADEAGIEWLEDVGEIMMRAFQESNFNVQINELYQEIVAFGTACLFITNRGEKDSPKLNFRAVHMESVVIAEDPYGYVDTCMMVRRMSARNAVDMWPDADLPIVQRRYEKNPDEQVRFLNVVMPNDNPAPDPSVADPADRPWLDLWYSMDDKVEVERSGYHEFPYMCPRWAKLPFEHYGFSPAILARPDIITLNEAKRYELSAWEKVIDPPMKARANGIVGDVHLEKAGVTFMREIDDLQPLMNATDWGATQIKSQELRDAIRSIFLIDQLHMPERPNATATEIRIRYQLMQRALGPVMGRLEAELLNPLIERVFGVLYRAGVLPEMPESMVDNDVDIEYQGPLAKGQKAAEAEAIEQLLAMAGNLAQVNPASFDILNLPETMRKLGDHYGVPADVMKSVEEVKKAGEEREQQQQAVMQQQMQGQQLEQAATAQEIQMDANEAA